MKVEVFEICAQRLAQQRRLDCVGACPCRFTHHVANIVDDIGIIAGTACHGVGPECSPFSVSLPAPPVMTLFSALPVPVKLPRRCR